MKTQNPQGLRNNPNPKPRENPAALLLHHFHVEYQAKGVPHVLLPGQLIPVWDLAKWKMVDTFDVHCSNAVRWNEFLISGPEHENQLENSVTAAAFQTLQKQNSDRETRALINRLARIPLGNVGGRRIVRPDSLPVGVIPMEARRINGDPTLEIENLSMLDWALETDGMEVAAPDVPLPELQFFMESEQGDQEGFNVRAGEAQTVEAIPLPFTYCSGEALNILRGEGDGLEREMQTLMALTEGFRQMAALNEWKGTVYFGYDLPSEGEGLPDVDTELMTLEYYLNNRADEEVIYEIPFFGDNPFDVLNKDAYDRINALLSRPRVRLRRNSLESLEQSAQRHAATV